MKLLRYGPTGRREAGAARRRTARSAAWPPWCATSTASRCRDAALKMIAGIDPKTLPKVDASVRLGSCVARPVNYVCIGLNYADHAAEAGMPLPKEPIIFLKSLGALCGPNDDVKMPRGSKKLDWEVELGIVIGKTARYVPEHEAMDHVAGYCVCNDVSRARVPDSSAPAPGTRARAATRSARPALGGDQGRDPRPAERCRCGPR